MGKIFAILLIVLGIWVGLGIYTEGTDRAFGGLFAGFSSGPAASAPAASGERPSPLHRIEDKAREARDLQLERIERQLDE